MSSTRRSANEVNILDMLDRQAKGPLPRRMLRRFLGKPAMVWYGAAGLAVCGLVGVLAWLAHDGGSSSVDTVLAGSIKPAVHVQAAALDTVGNAPLVASAAEPAQAPDSVPDSTQDSAQGSAQPGEQAAGATIVDVAPPAGPHTLAAAGPAPVHAHALPQQQAAGRIAVHEAQRDAPRAAVHAAAKAGARVARAAAAAPRNRRQPAPAMAAPAAVDTDVALITAIIQHANARQEAEEAGCDYKGCGARKP
jgi:hypothetical protein